MQPINQNGNQTKAECTHADLFQPTQTVEKKQIKSRRNVCVCIIYSTFEKFFCGTCAKVRKAFLLGSWAYVTYLECGTLLFFVLFYLVNTFGCCQFTAIVLIQSWNQLPYFYLICNEMQTQQMTIVWIVIKFNKVISEISLPRDFFFCSFFSIYRIN